MMKQNAAEEWTKCATANMTAIITGTTGLQDQQVLIADLRILTDHHREETMNGSIANR